MKKQVKIIIFVVILLVIVIGIVTIVNNNNKERKVNDYCNKYGLYGNFVYNNKIEIKVKNIATNKIIGMDRHHIKWKECYISDPKRGDYNTTDWQLEESGLVGDIYLIGND